MINWIYLNNRLSRRADRLRFLTARTVKIMNPFEEVRLEQEAALQQTIEEFEKARNSDHYKQEQRFLSAFSFDAINTVRAISDYSTRARSLYDEFLTIKASDDLIQSFIAILLLMDNGIHNIAKREIRYLLEMTLKYLIVDQEQQGKTLREKTQYLNDEVPNSSIDVTERVYLPFEAGVNQEFIGDVKDVFYKACAFVHPSQQQIEEQIRNYERRSYIGFETPKMFESTNKTVFRAYDLIFTMLFVGFGQSMSGDLFIEVFDQNPKWQFHKGKYVRQYSKLFNYKLERQNKKN